VSEAPGFFVVIDGPSGVGKSTVTALLHAELVSRRIPAFATKEPSDSPIGNLARMGTEEYRGLVLACLVTADRYYHLEHDIRPALRAGYVVLCDRYVPTSLVLQHLDGVGRSYLAHLNEYADPPDLTVILTGQPELSGKRAEKRGTYSRFHDGGIAARVVEDRAYRNVADALAADEQPVLHYDVSDEPPETVAGVVLETLLVRIDQRLR